jgi:hypothetical protein
LPAHVGADSEHGGCASTRRGRHFSSGAIERLPSSVGEHYCHAQCRKAAGGCQTDAARRTRNYGHVAGGQGGRKGWLIRHRTRIPCGAVVRPEDDAALRKVKAGLGALEASIERANSGSLTRGRA